MVFISLQGEEGVLYNVRYNSTAEFLYFIRSTSASMEFYIVVCVIVYQKLAVVMQ